MGYSTTSDIVPFIVHSVLESSLDEVYNNHKLCLLCKPISLIECGYDKHNKDNVILNLSNYIYNDWVIVLNDDKTIAEPDFGFKNKMFGYSFKKDNYQVFIINESQDSSGYDINLAVVANDKESIELFLKNWGLKGPIEINDTCQQTL